MIDVDKITIAIYYHGGFPRYHTVTREFYERLLIVLSKKPWSNADIIIQVIR